MILKWKDSTEFKNYEKMVGILYDAGIVSRDQLSVISGWTLDSTDKVISELKKKEYVKKIFVSQRHVAYALTNSGTAYAKSMIDNSFSLGNHIAPESQRSHFMGINQILVNLIKQFGRENIDWLSTKEATDQLIYLRQKSGESEVTVSKTLIRPDAAAVINNHFCWIEFDNDTENANQLLKKYRLYNMTNLNKVAKTYKTVIWVAKTERRIEYLKKIQEDFNQNGVKMKFYVLGQEYKEFLSDDSKTLINTEISDDKGEIDSMITIE